MPIIIEATKAEVDDFLENNEEDLHLSWRFWKGKFIVEELNTEDHENAVAECAVQLSAAVRSAQVPGMVLSLNPSLNAPDGYPNESGKIKPDACIMNRKKKVSATAHANGMAANDNGRFYPSVVVEVGFSQKEASLKEKVNAWLTAGDDRTGVRCVIEINVQGGTPPGWIKFRINRREQARVPRYRTITAQDYAENPNHARYKEVLTAEEVCYPADVPDGFEGITFDFGQVYASLPGFYSSSDQDESESEGDSEDEGDGDSEDESDGNSEDESDGDGSTAREGGVLANLSGRPSKRQPLRGGI